MSARQDINQLLGHWRRLTDAEAGAIQSAAWAALREIQSSKSALQSTISAALEKWSAEHDGVPANTDKHPFRAEVGRLLSLETRNAELLAAQIRRAKAEKQTLADTLRNLRRLSRSYGEKPAKAWESYS